MEILFLGTGTSHGIPMIGCDCEVCASADPRDHRTRASALLSWDGRNVLVDTATDLRQQMLACRITHVEAILFTHTHADHVHGIDDVRSFSSRSKAPLPACARPKDCDFLRRTFSYIFHVNPANMNVPRIELIPVVGPFELFGKRVTPVPVDHGPDVILGYRVGDAAYLPDCSGIPPSSRPLLEGLDILVIDALRATPHPTHFSLPESLEAIRQVAPRRAYLTGLCHRLPHAATCAGLPPGVDAAFDGLRVTSP